MRSKLKPGERVMIIGNHPWASYAGTLVAFEEYGPGHGLRWKGWRIRLDGNYSQCYASEHELSVPRVDSMRYTARRLGSGTPRRSGLKAEI